MRLQFVFGIFVSLFLLMSFAVQAEDISLEWFDYEDMALKASEEENTKLAAELYALAADAYVESGGRDPDRYASFMWPQHFYYRDIDDRLGMDEVLLKAMRTLRDFGRESDFALARFYLARALFMLDSGNEHKAVRVATEMLRELKDIYGEKSVQSLRADYEYWSFLGRNYLIRSNQVMKYMGDITKRAYDYLDEDIVAFYQAAFMGSIWLGYNEPAKAYQAGLLAWQLMSDVEDRIPDAFEMNIFVAKTILASLWAGAQDEMFIEFQKEVKNRGIVLPKADPLIQPSPEYHFDAEASGYDGVVKVKFDVASSGNVQNVEIIGSNGNEVFEENVHAAMATWVFPTLTGDEEESRNSEFQAVFRVTSPMVQRMLDNSVMRWRSGWNDSRTERVSSFGTGSLSAYIIY